MDVVDLAEVAGVNRDTIAAIEKGKGFRTSSLTKIERALGQLEEEMGIDTPVAPSAPTGLVEFEVTGDFGVRVVVRGPVSDLPELQRSVTELVRGMKSRSDDDHGDETDASA